MKQPKEWQTAFDATDMATATASELQTWIGKIQEDARAEFKSALSELCLEIEQRTFEHHGARECSYAGGVVCSEKTLQKAKALAGRMADYWCIRCKASFKAGYDDDPHSPNKTCPTCKHDDTYLAGLP